MDGSMDSGKCEGHCKCNCMHHKVVPAMVLLIAVAFFAGAMGWLSATTVSLAWPILLAVAAGTKLKEGSCKCC